MVEFFEIGQVAKWSNATDCKSVGSGLRRFDSSPAHDDCGLSIHNRGPQRRIGCGSNSVGRVTAFQAVGRGFESRLPLQKIVDRPKDPFGVDPPSTIVDCMLA